MRGKSTPLLCFILVVIAFPVAVLAQAAVPRDSDQPQGFDRHESELELVSVTIVPDSAQAGKHPDLSRISVISNSANIGAIVNGRKDIEGNVFAPVGTDHVACSALYHKSLRVDFPRPIRAGEVAIVEVRGDSLFRKPISTIGTFWDECATPLTRIAPMPLDTDCAPEAHGTVLLDVEIYDDGSVQRIDVIQSLQSGPNGYDELAIKAVRHWKFSPAVENGVAVPVWIQFPMDFPPKPNDPWDGYMTPDGQVVMFEEE